MKSKKVKQLEVKGINYIILLSLALVVSNVLVNYSFGCFGHLILVSVFVYPLTFFFANMITKRHGYINTLFGILGALIMQLLVFVGFALSAEINIELLIVLGTLISFTVMQLINLELYLKFQDGKGSYLKLWLLYTVVILGDSLIFSFIINKGLFCDFGIAFLISVIIKVLVGSGLAFIDQRQAN